MAISRQQLEKLYLGLERPLYNFALRWLWNPAVAQELVQDAFVRIWHRRIDVRTDSVKALLYKTVTNLAINERRRQKVRELTPLKELFNFTNERGPEESLIQRQDLRHLYLSLEDLPVDLKKVLLLCEFSDMTYAEIGSIENIPEGTVASRKNRAMKLVKENFKFIGVFDRE